MARGGARRAITGAAFDSAAAQSLRLRDNAGSTQISPIAFGTPLDVAITSNAITVKSSYVRITAGTGPLNIITGGTAGDVLVLTASISISVQSTTGVGNIKLASTSLVLNNAKDTLTLIFDGTFWLEVSFSDNA